MNDFHEYISRIRDIVKERANEVSHRLNKDDIETIRETLALIDELEDELNVVNEIIDCAWDSVETF